LEGNITRFSREKVLKLYFNLAKDILDYGIFAAVSKCSGLILLPILTRLFTEQEYGTFDVIISISVFASILISLSLESALVRFWSSGVDRKLNAEKFTTCLITIFISGLLIITISLIVVILPLSVLENHQDIVWLIPIAVTSALFQVLFNLTNTCFRMCREIIKFNVMNLLYTVIYTVGSLLFILEFDYGIAGLFFGSLTSGIFCLLLSLFLNRDFLTLSYSSKRLFSFLKYSIPTMPGVFTSLVNTRADRFIILHFLGFTTAGIYAAVFTYTSILQVLVSIFRNAWMPHSIKALSEDVVTRDKIYVNILHCYLLTFILLGSVFVLCSAFLMKLILPPVYQSGIVIVPWLVGAVILHGASSVANVGTVVTQKTIGNSYASILALVSNILCSIFLIEKYGLKGAAIGTFISEVLFFGFLLFLSHKQIKISFNYLFIAAILVLYSLFCFWLTFFDPEMYQL
jgi:O-antigen/teichoic acid export membrane protein